MNNCRGSVLAYDWYKSGEGQGLLAHLTHPATGHRRLYGSLEYPNIPPSIECAEFKLYLVGESGVGKTAVASWLAGLQGWNRQSGESPGVRMTTLYWPAKVQNSLVFFKLDLWEAGDGASKKYGHVFPSCRDGAHAVLPVFSFTDRATWQEIPELISRATGPTQQQPAFPIVIGNRFGLGSDTTVSATEVAEFEATTNISVVRVRNQTNSSNPASLPEVASALNTICEQLWVARMRSKHSDFIG